MLINGVYIPEDQIDLKSLPLQFSYLISNTDRSQQLDPIQQKIFNRAVEQYKTLDSQLQNVKNQNKSQKLDPSGLSFLINNSVVQSDLKFYQKAQTLIGETFIHNGDFKNAITAIDEAAIVAVNTENYPFAENLYNKLAQLHINNNSFDSYKKGLETSLINIEIRSQDFEIRTRLALGAVYRATGEHNKSLDMYNKAYSLKQSLQSGPNLNASFDVPKAIQTPILTKEEKESILQQYLNASEITSGDGSKIFESPASHLVKAAEEIYKTDPVLTREVLKQHVKKMTSKSNIANSAKLEEVINQKIDKMIVSGRTETLKNIKKEMRQTYYSYQYNQENISKEQVATKPNAATTPTEAKLRKRDMIAAVVATIVSNITALVQRIFRKNSDKAIEAPATNIPQKNSPQKDQNKTINNFIQKSPVEQKPNITAKATPNVRNKQHNSPGVS